jgi:hypothetical protein
LPPDLPEYLGQLQTLQVPAAVSRLDWIAPTLKELEAENTTVKEVPFLPALERLSISSVRTLTRIPVLPSVRDLDLRFTGFRGPWIFPDSLETLSLGGQEVTDLEGLRESSLLELTLDNVPGLRSTEGLPDTLQYFSISAATFSDLKDLPTDLKELRLLYTNVLQLRDLPESLQSITLIGNGYMDRKDIELPPSVLSLTVDKVPAAANFPYLSRLELRSPASLDMASSSLRDLQVPMFKMLAQLSNKPSVRRLSITNSPAAGEKQGKFPSQRFETLEHLIWPGAADLSDLPLTLKHLDIPGSPLPSLAGLPSGLTLTSLDVTGTNMKIAELPRTLRHLRYGFCTFPEIKGLPPGLLSLNIEGSRDVTTMERLPRGLWSLDISETSLSALPELPDSLLEVDISNSRIDSLSDLRGLTRLRKLTVHAGQLGSLAGLPKSVRELHFVKSNP